MNQKKPMDTHALTGAAIFAAVVFVLQLLGSFIRFGPFSISLVMIPIVVGAALYGPFVGAFLGFVFSVAVFISGDAAAFLAVNIPGTIITVLAKGTLAGWAAGVIFSAVEKKNIWFAVVCAAVLAPVVNTGIFLLGCQVFFLPTITEWGMAMGFESVGKYMIYGLVGGNFLVEMLSDIVFSPLILRLIHIGRGERA